jgi:hypothetical protein
VPLPMNPLMLAVGSRNSPAVTCYRVNILPRMSGRDPSVRTPGTPSVIMSPDSSVHPDKAGRRQHLLTLALGCTPSPTLGEAT